MNINLKGWDMEPIIRKRGRTSAYGGRRGRRPYGCTPLPEGFEELCRAARLVWFVLCTFTEWEAGLEYGRCWPSQDRMARRAGCSVNHIKTGLAALEAAGLIQRRRWGSRGKIATTEYLLVPCGISPDGAEEGHPVTEDVSPGGCEGYHPVAEGVSPDGGEGCHQEAINITSEQYQKTIPEEHGSEPDFSHEAPERREPRPEGEGAQGGEGPSPREELPLVRRLERAFGELFRVYPNRSYEAEARRLFLRVFEGADVGEAQRRLTRMQDRLNAEAENWDLDNPRYVPQFGNWLRRTYELD